MSEFVIFENPGNKAARLERENAQLKAENHMLREQLGQQTGEMISSQVASMAPALPQAQTFNHGACQVTIGAKPTNRKPTAIPSLQQPGTTQETQPGETEVQIFDRNAQAPAPAPRRATTARRPGIGGPPGGGGGVTFDLSALRPVPVRPSPSNPAELALDDARQRFQLLELDELPEQQTSGSSAGGTSNSDKKVG
jgi:hypothetical protein